MLLRKQVRSSLVVLAVAAVLPVPHDAEALPHGKSWMPVERLFHEEFPYLPSPQLDTDPEGRPTLVVSAWRSDIRDVAGMEWSDSSWKQQWMLGHYTSGLVSALSPSGTTFLIWSGSELNNEDRAFFAEMGETGPVAIDTVTRVIPYLNALAGAVAPGGRRWVTIKDNPVNKGQVHRLLYSDSLGHWNEILMPGTATNGVAIAALDDKTALVISGELLGLEYAIATDTGLVERGPLPAFGDHGLLPELRSGASGPWLAWGTYGTHVGISHYRNGFWAAPESLRCDYTDARQSYTASPSMSRDGVTFPVVIWSAYNSWTGGDVICACLSTDSGFTIADEIWAGESALSPTAARDVNGDAWVAWWTRQTPAGTYWTHTYTKATSSAPRVTLEASRRRVAWSLSELAPETWWAVMRARGAAPYEIAARVRAGHGTEMSWTDSTPAAGVVRYRIRRECLDTRYQWFSEEAMWPSGSRKPFALAGIPSPFHADGIITLIGAEPGPVEVRLHDLQGRLLLTERLVASGEGRDSIQIHFESASSHVRAGVYFVRVRDSADRWAEAKLVLLR